MLLPFGIIEKTEEKERSAFITVLSVRFGSGTVEPYQRYNMNSAGGNRTLFRYRYYREKVPEDSPPRGCADGDFK